MIRERKKIIVDPTQPGNPLIAVLKRIFMASFAIAVFLIAWEVAARLELVSVPTFFPPISTIIAALADEAAKGALWTNTLISLRRSLIGFGLGLLVAIPLGLAIGWFRLFGDLINPLIQVFRNLPTLALLPVFVMFFGIGEFSKVMVILWSVLWYTLLNTISGVRAVDPQLIKAARSMGTGNLRLFGAVVLPAALPFIFTGVRISATISILVLIAAEMMGANSGLGYAMFFYQGQFMIPQMFAYIFVMAIVGAALNFILEHVEKRAFRWRDDSGAT
ncbi:MAG: ABC transporter permease [Clostridiales Family XIII bacterium]|jgi:NitT/TauT family transport system permease protein|nr:ABC transporter permease [Clostridiales Family XIII bacterium]